MTGFSNSNFGQQIFSAINSNFRTTKEEKKGNERNNFFSNPVSSGSPLDSLAGVSSQVESMLAEANATIEGFNIERNSKDTSNYSSLTSSPGSASNFLFNSRMNSMVSNSISQANRTMGEILERQQALEKVKPLAYAIHDAVDGIGTDEKTIFQVLNNLNPTERAELEEFYNDKFGNGYPDTLRNHLKGDLSGSDETKALGLLNKQGKKSDSKALAFQLYEAMKGLGTDEEAVKKIFNNTSPQELRQIEESFDEITNKKGSLRDWIRSDFSGSTERSLLNQLNKSAVADTAEQKEIEAKIAERANREPVKDPVYKAIDNANGTLLDVQRSQAEKAKVRAVDTAINDAVDGWGTDEKTVLDTLQSLKPEHRAELERKYTRDGKNLREDLRGELSGSDERKALDLLNEGVNSDSKVAAVALKEAMEGWGTDEKTVKTIMNNASPEELRDIEKAFDEMQGKQGALRDWIKGDFSGSDRKMLIAQLNRSALTN